MSIQFSDHYYIGNKANAAATPPVGIGIKRSKPELLAKPNDALYIEFTPMP